MKRIATVLLIALALLLFGCGRPFTAPDRVCYIQERTVWGYSETNPTDSFPALTIHERVCE